jgi:hypothetical protein
MRPWLLFALLAACGDDRLPNFATGQPYGFAMDGGGLDASPDAGDSSPNR